MSLDSLFKQANEQANKHANMQANEQSKKPQQDFSDDEISGEFRSRAELESSADDEKRNAKTTKRQQNSRKNVNDNAALPEKKRARRRLIGAVALVLAAVIGLPMVFDSEPKPALHKIAVEIPSKDTPFSASTPVPARPTLNEPAQAAIDPTEEIVGNPTAPNSPATPPNSVTTDIKTVVAGAAVKPTLAPAPAVTGKVPEVKLAPAAKKIDAPAVAATPAPVAGKTENKKDRRDDEARALALLEGREPPAPEQKAEVSSKAGSFAIQVAALNSSAKVKELQNSLKAAQIQSYTQKVITKTGEVSRVRVGPFANKAEAEKMRAKLVKLGLNASLIPL